MTQDIAAETGFEGLDTGTDKSVFKRWIMLFLIFLFVAGISSLASASGQIFSISKNICAGVPSALDDPADCQLATQVPMGSPVYYVITITSPWGQSQQQVDLIDDFKPEFSPTTNGLYCIDGDTGNPVPYIPSTQPHGVASVTLNMGQTIHCFVPGTFNASGNSENTVKGINKDNYDADADVETHVLSTTPLNADLSIDKTASASQIDVTSGAATLTYTITIKNNGPADVDVGDYFKLYDKLSLLPNGVPFNVAYVGATCGTIVATANATDPQQTDCLDTAGPNLYGSSPILVGTAAQTNFFNWGFATGSNGHINAGDSIVLTITVNISQLAGLNCVAALNADGLRNTAFFNLTNATNGTAYSEVNNLNNTDSVNTAVTTGQTQVIPGCGTGHLRVTKKQISPANPVAWGTPVTYEITIENASVPNQPITIQKADLQDLVTQGINTPKFTAVHMGTGCVLAPPGVCASFNANSPSVNDVTPLAYAYYGHNQLTWDSLDPITLNHGEKIVLKTQFVYQKPDCTTVPNAPIRPIFNTVKVKYQATPFGAPLSTSPVTFHQDDTAETDMMKVKPCAFSVTKEVKNEGGAQLQFGVPFDYIVTYTNNGNDRDIGTIMDAVRIDIPGYASSLPFSSTFSCISSTGVTGFNNSGGYSSGFAVNTTTPAQGSPAANIGSNVHFPQNSTLSCHITITVDRPKFDDKYCTSKPAKFENMALMDTTNPFNNNIFWPPSSTYTNGAYSNPPVQTENWATASLDLPKCWDAIINKSAAVAGLPSTNAPWTYPGNPNAINYTITTTNTSQGTWGDPSSPNPGWVVTDNFVDPSNTGIPSAYYNNSNVQQGHSAPLAPVCNAAGWCWTTAPHDGTSTIGVKNLAAGQNGIWNIQYTGPIKNGQDVANCADISVPSGTATDSSYYSNFDPSKPKRDCVTIPVVEVTKIPVQKIVDDQTGAGIKAAGPFGFSASCAPYPLQTVSSTFSLSTNALNGTSPIHNIFPVPVNSSSCTITETSKPAVPNAAITACIAKLGAGASAVWQTSGSPTTLTGPLSQNVGTVKITNSLVCVPPKPVKLTIIKRVENPTLPNGQVIPALTFPIDVNCSPAATPNTVNIPAGTLQGQDTVLVQAGAKCTVSEPNPPIPPLVYEYCRGKGMKAQWVTTYSPSNPFAVGANGATVIVSNKWECVGDKDSAVINVTKILKGPVDLPRDLLSSLYFTITANCTPAATPNSVSIIAGQTAQFNVQLGAVCTFTETLPPMPDEFVKYCEKRGMVPEWNTPMFAPSATIVIKKKKQSLEVINTWRCIKKIPPPYGTVNLIKRIDTGPMPAPINLPPQNYTINIACTPGPVSPTSVVLPAGTTPGTGSFSAPIGAVCTLTETPPAMPQAITDYCKSIGSTGATWNTPAIPSVTVNQPNQTIAIVNTWQCKPATAGQLEVIKSFTTKQFPVLWPATSWTINTNCTPSGSASSVTINTPASGNAVITGSSLVTAPIGATCTVNEPTPTQGFPNWVTNYCALPANGGGLPIWDVPTYTVNGVTTTTPPTVGMTGGIQTVTVNNAWHCGTSPNGTLTVIKTVNTPQGPIQFPQKSWLINTNCTPAGSASSVTLTTAATGNASVTSLPGSITAPIGATCTVSEAQPAPAFLPSWATSYCAIPANGGGAPIWDAPTYTVNGQTTTTPPTVGITAGNQTVTVTNAWHCGTVVAGPGLMTIIKDISGPLNGIFNTTTFSVGVTCAPSGATNTVTLSYATGGLWKGTVNVAAGDTCTFTETPPLVTAAMTSYCAGQNGQIAVWDPPTYANGQTKTGNGGNQNFNLVNTWHCAPNTNGQVQIFKIVHGPTQQIPAMPFVINSNCTTPSIPASVTITTSTTGGGGAVSAPVGTGCQFTETQPGFSASQTAYCAGQNGAIPQWAAPSYSIAQPMTVTGSLQNLFVTNDWSCVQPTTPGTIKVYKLVYGPSIPGMFVPQMTQQTYSFASNCVAPSTPATVSVTTIANGISSAPFVAPVGTSCTITETQPATWPQTITDFCAGLTPGGQVPQWEPPTFNIAQPMTSTTASQTVTVTNRWKCAASTLKVKPKKKSKFKFNIGIGIGGGGGGGRDKPRDKQPDTPGRP